jgi:hypothetical protein
MERRDQISIPLLDPAMRQEIEHIARREERTVAQQVRRWIADGLAAARAAGQGEGIAA